MEVRLETEVTGISLCGDHFEVTVKTNQGTEVLETKFVVNAAGVHSEEVCSYISKPNFHIVPNKGQYYLLDKTQGALVERVIFQCPSKVGKGVLVSPTAQCPSKVGKGVLVSPTAHGNLIVGPDAVDVNNAEDVSTTAQQLAFVRNTAARTCDKINYRESIRNFAGVRAQGTVDEFIVGTVPETDRFINIANIKSPGLTSSPAIAVDVVSMMGEAGLPLKEKDDYVKTRQIVRFRELDEAGKQRIIEKDPRYGRVICRCETITEGEIVAAIHAPIGARTVDGVKRRCNAGMGRCQGGFCSPRVLDIICRETGLKPEEIRKDKAGSNILIGQTPKGQDKASV